MWDLGALCRVVSVGDYSVRCGAGAGDLASSLGVIAYDDVIVARWCASSYSPIRVVRERNRLRCELCSGRTTYGAVGPALVGDDRPLGLSYVEDVVANLQRLSRRCLGVEVDVVELGGGAGVSDADQN